MLDIKTENLQRQQKQQKRQQHIDFYRYLQLANGYYERTLQANVKYLQSIGRANAIRQQQQRQKQQRHKQQRRHSLEAWPQQQQQRQQREQQIAAAAAAAVVDPQSAQADSAAGLSAILQQSCQTAGIRVHIAPVQQQPQQQRSMCDYKNKHNNNINNNNSNKHNKKSESNRKSATAEIIDQAQQQRKLYEIIDNLSELSVCDSRSSDKRLIHLSQLSLCDSRNSLPRITFTDYTQQVALYGANFEFPTTKPDHQTH